MKLKLLPGKYSICKINDISDINLRDPYIFIAKTPDEISLVCNSDYVPYHSIAQEDGFKCFRFEEILDFSLIGILAKISKTLADYKISIFVISTYNTDYILVKDNDLDYSLEVLAKQGYEIIT